MTMFTAAEIAEFRAFSEDEGMPDTCTISGDVRTRDGEGGYTTTPGATTTVACRLRSTGLQPQERVIAERLGWTVPYAIDLPVSAVVTPSKRITIGSRRFEVGGIVTEGDWARRQVAVVKEVGSGN